jgi:membrane dipeptidase
VIFIKIFDTHCDTAYELHDKKLPFDNDITHITKKQIDKYEIYEQLFAVWSNPKRTDDENWEHYKQVKKHFEEYLLPHKSEKFIPHLSVEGGALLGKHLSRLDTLKADNVRMMTLVWKDECEIGGAHNTNKGLTPFGKDVLRKMCGLGIIPDISHASDKMSYETFETASEYGMPVCASHSNSRKIREHTRNMTDDMFLKIKNTNGLVGINFCCDFLEDTEIKPAGISSIIRHIEHFMSLGGQKTVCLGCDFDGITELPNGIEGVKSHNILYDELKKLNYSESLIEDIFYNNAHGFFEKH